MQYLELIDQKIDVLLPVRKISIGARYGVTEFLEIHAGRVDDEVASPASLIDVSSRASNRQVIVVRHQHPRENRPTVALLYKPEQLDKPQCRFRIGERSFPAREPVVYVVDPPSKTTLGVRGINHLHRPADHNSVTPYLALIEGL